MIEFRAWPKIPRLFRDCLITEKIDGTNAAIIITEEGEIGAQIRNRIITPEDDNYGFASWVQANAEALKTQQALAELAAIGSRAAPGFTGEAEGVVVYHVAANISFKVTLHNDAEPKGKMRQG